MRNSFVQVGVVNYGSDGLSWWMESQLVNVDAIRHVRRSPGLELAGNRLPERVVLYFDEQHRLEIVMNFLDAGSHLRAS